MNRTPFGRTGLEVSPLGFGAAEVGFFKADQDRVAGILNVLLDAGVNLIDTAAGYEGSEELIGRAVAHRRGEYILVSKCGTKVPQAEGRPWSEQLITKTVDASLRRLKADVLDVMLLHSCDLGTLKQGEALGALVKAREAGKIRFVGFSGDNEAAAWAAAHPDVAVIQTSVSIADQANIDGVLPVARKHNMGVMAKRPIANAAWLGASGRLGFYDSYVKPYVDRLTRMNLKPADAGFRGAEETAWPELALRFTLSQPGVHCAIIGTTNPDNARANIAYAEKGPLPQDAVAQIRQAFRRADPTRAWVGLT
jgi:aryl-alcohol dehydrogenase-like predicted oxidoreductase